MGRLQDIPSRLLIYGTSVHTVAGTYRLINGSWKLKRFTLCSVPKTVWTIPGSVWIRENFLVWDFDACTNVTPKLDHQHTGQAEYWIRLFSLHSHPFRLSLFTGNIDISCESRHLIRCDHIWSWWKLNCPGCFLKQSVVAKAIVNRPQSRLQHCICTSTNFRMIRGCWVNSTAAVVWFTSGIMLQYMESHIYLTIPNCWYR